MIATRVASRSGFIKRFSAPASGIRCFPFWELVAAAGCPHQCAYCFLQGTPSYVFGHYPLSGIVFSNWPQMVREVEGWLEAPTPATLVLGELQDGLAFEDHYKAMAGSSLTQLLVPLFKAQKKHRLVVLTKSLAIQYARRLKPTDRVVFSWSVNSAHAARQWERGAPSPFKRLAAAARMKTLGWPVSLRLDPMIPHPAWRDAYARCIDAIDAIGPEMVTLGALRASNSLRGQAARNGRDASVFDYLDGKDPAGFKHRIPLEVRLDLFRFALDRLDRRRIIVALCKEHREVWDALRLPFRGCHCLGAMRARAAQA